MSIIPGTVPERLYEKVRDKIAQIILTELPAQGVLRGDAYIGGINKVYIERGWPADMEELPMINVTLDKTSFTQLTQVNNDFEAEYNIHIYGNVKSSTGGRGDEGSSKMVAKIAGLIEGIISYGGYSTLGFPYPTSGNEEGISGREVYETLYLNPNDTNDANPIFRSVVRVKVMGNQPLNLDALNTLEGVDTQACLFNSNECYFYTSEGTPPPTPQPDHNTSVLTVNGLDFLTVIVGSTTDIILQDQNTVPIIPLSINNNVITVDLPDPLNVGGITIQTGQTVSSVPNDDGDLQQGSLVDFFTLASNNVFGNTDRFIDTLGGQVYANDIMLDSAYTNGVIIHGWRLTEVNSLSFNNSILDATALVVDGFSTWFVPNRKQNETLINSDLSVCTNWSPLDISVTKVLRTNTTDPNNSGNGFALLNSSHSMFAENKLFTGSRAYVPFRIFTYAELGL